MSEKTENKELNFKNKHGFKKKRIIVVWGEGSQICDVLRSGGILVTKGRGGGVKSETKCVTYFMDSP